MTESPVSAGRRFVKDFSTNLLLISSVHFKADSWVQSRRMGHVVWCGVGIWFPCFVWHVQARRASDRRFTSSKNGLLHDTARRLSYDETCIGAHTVVGVNG